MQPTHHQTHQAGRHIAVAEALIRGHRAELGPFTRTYVLVDGIKAQVQVAAKGAWQIENVDQYTDASIAVNILVDMTGDLRKVYICPGAELREQVRERHRQFLAAHDDRRPRNPFSKHTAIYPEQVRAWHNNWQLFAAL